MRAREVRERLKGRIDPEVSYVIEALAEQMSVYDQALTSLAEMQNKMIDLIANFSVIGENMKEVLNKIKGEDGGPDVTL